MSGERDAQARAQFQERRRAWLIWQAASFAVLLAGAGLGVLFEDKWPMWIPLIVIGLGEAKYRPATGFRCPRCDNYVGRGDGPLDPKSCEECGFQFK